MKRSEVVLKMARYYNMKSVMVEYGYIDAMEFCSLLLQLTEEMGMLPPRRNADLKSSYGYAQIYEWEKE